MPTKITVLGSGTSMGVPTIGCHCDVCTSPDPRDNRLRPSILVTQEGRNVLIDTTPDFRTQALRAGIDRLDAVLFTHEHADHIMGLDDVRPFNFRQKDGIPIYASRPPCRSSAAASSTSSTADTRSPTCPRIECRLLDGAPFDALRPRVRARAAAARLLPIYGFRFGKAAYLTDHSEMPEASLELLRGLDVLFLDALRFKPHPTHSTVDRSLATAERLGARRVFFTHICHDLPHERTESRLPPHVRLAYDGLEILVEDCG